MRLFALSLAATTVCLLAPAPAAQAEVRGQYLEARTCDVYTGPCFANGEMGMAGKEALMAWKVDEGDWNGIGLAGLTVALVLKADNSLGDDGVFPMKPGKIKSVILVDENADERQHAALVDFVKQTAADYTQDVRKIEKTEMTLQADQITHQSVFKAGRVAEIRTRSLVENDCICTNEMVFFKPLVDVSYPMPAYSLTQTYAGDGLGSQWSLNGSRSAFLAVFKK